LFIYGKALYYLGETKEGQKALVEALQLDPDFQKCRDFRKKVQKMEQVKEEGNKLFKEGKLEEAYEKYDSAIKLDPLNATTASKLYFNKSAVAIKMKKYDFAINDATKAIELDKEYTKAYQRRAQCYMETDKWDEALADLNKAKELDSNDNEILTQIKKCEKQRKVAQRKDYYKILGITKSADENDIKKAYKKQCGIHHPDRWQDEKEKKST